LTDRYHATVKELLDNAKRVLIKVGTSVSLTEDRQVDTRIIGSFYDSVKFLQERGKQVAMVVSGSKGLQLANEGLPATYFDDIKDPAERREEKNRILAQGSASLYTTWQEHFHDIHLFPLLLTRREMGMAASNAELLNRCKSEIVRDIDAYCASIAHLSNLDEKVFALKRRQLLDLTNTTFQRNIASTTDLGEMITKMTLRQMEMGNVPFINEYDLIAFGDAFGNNDALAVFMSNTLNADVLFTTTDVDGLWNTNPSFISQPGINDKCVQRISHIDEITRKVIGFAKADETSARVGTGDMYAKLAALSGLNSNILATIANGKIPDILRNFFETYKLDNGTVFMPQDHLGNRYRSSTPLVEVVRHLSQNIPGENNYSIERKRKVNETALQNQPIYLELCLRSNSNGTLRSPMRISTFKIAPDGNIYFYDKKSEKTKPVTKDLEFGKYILQASEKEGRSEYDKLVTKGTIPHVFASAVYGLEGTNRRHTFKLVEFGTQYTLQTTK
jgi:glutamate 5-kinase